MATTAVNPADGQGTTPNPSAPRVYTQEEVERLTNQIRSEEKDKLYKDLSHFKSKSSELESTLEKLKEEKQKNFESNTQQQTAELQSKINELTEELKTSRSQFETEFSDKLKQAVDQTLTTATEEFKKIRQQDRISDRKEALIHAAEGKIIPELVSGNTVEEVEASVQKAKEAFQRIYEAGKAEAANGALPRPLNVGGSNATNGQDTNGIPELDNLRKLTPKEWETQGPSIKESVYAKLGLRPKQ